MAPWLPCVRIGPQTYCFPLTMSVESKKNKKVFTPSDVLFSTEKHWWRANEKKSLVSRSGFSSKRRNALLLSSQCATHGACATGWPPLSQMLSKIGSLSTTGTQNILFDRFMNLFFRFNTSTGAAYNRGRLALIFSA